MRLAMVCPYSLSRPGGVQGQALGLATALRRRGHQVWVFAPAASPQALEDPGSEAGGTVVVGGAVPVPANGSVAPVALWPGAALRVRKEVVDRGIEVAHLHEPLAPVLSYGLLVRPPVALVATFHRAGAGAGYRLVSPLARWAGGRIAVRCAVSEAAMATAGAVMGGPFELLFNGVDVARFAAAREVLRPCGGAVVRMLFVGRHERRKGLEVLLEALARPEADGGIDLFITGDGPMTQELAARFPPSDRRHWLGVVSDQELVSQMGKAQVLCAPALSGESFGMVILEGLAAGCAVAASDIPGYRQAAGGHAQLVAPGDPRAWAEALSALAGEARAHQGRLAPAALAHAAHHAAGWSMDHLAHCYEERYHRALGTPSPGT